MSVRVGKQARDVERGGNQKAGQSLPGIQAKPIMRGRLPPYPLFPIRRGREEWLRHRGRRE